VDPRKLLRRLAQGALHNVAFRDMLRLAEGFGFRVLRIRGSHHILGHPSVPEMVNLQEVKGKAKPYQIRQFLKLVERHNLALEDEQ
jgi:predicted RNA binding protein YcfA (HicA-like mRNA interferase family)